MSETLSASLPSDLEARITRVLQNLCDRNLTVATVESCTGGLIASVLTDVEGCGHAFERGFITYSEAAKIEDVDVPAALIEAHTAVSAEVAEAMARGGLRRSTADLALSVTGYAGPAGDGTEEGLVHLALARREGGVVCAERHFGAIGRGGVRMATLEAAVDLVESALNQA
ncbi:CinA family protein [Brevundimonas bacteroides]|uniref:CinA family protein n=1 Tax=Brevundimonas bacteroides TaxID=74311 RepID=UPI00049807EC|nr:CinA family protein [Brevundimonas bacteroides]